MIAGAYTYTVYVTEYMFVNRKIGRYPKTISIKYSKLYKFVFNPRKGKYSKTLSSQQTMGRSHSKISLSNFNMTNLNGKKISKFHSCGA